MSMNLGTLYEYQRCFKSFQCSWLLLLTALSPALIKWEKRKSDSFASVTCSCNWFSSLLFQLVYILILGDSFVHGCWVALFVLSCWIALETFGYRLALDKDPEYVRALIVMGQTLLQNGQLAEATEYLERAIYKVLIHICFILFRFYAPFIFMVCLSLVKRLLHICNLWWSWYWDLAMSYRNHVFILPLSGLILLVVDTLV